MVGFKSIELNSLDKKFFNNAMKTEFCQKKKKNWLKIGLLEVIKSLCIKLLELILN